MITAKKIISLFVSEDGYGAHSARIVQESGRTITLEAVMTRNQYQQYVEKHLDEDYRADPNESTDWQGEIKGMERQDAPGRSERTGGGTYRYTILITKF
jgi:hypothetical protein